MLSTGRLWARIPPASPVRISDGVLGLWGVQEQGLGNAGERQPSISGHDQNHFYFARPFEGFHSGVGGFNGLMQFFMSEEAGL